MKAIGHVNSKGTVLLMKRFVLVLCIFAFVSMAFIGCSGSVRQDTKEGAAAGPAVAEGKSGKPYSNSQDNPLEGQFQVQPIERHGSKLELPSGFPSDIIPIVKNANITDTYEDGVSFSVTYQTTKAFKEVAGTYKRFMESAKLIMEDKQGDTYYTVNGTKDNNNIFIVVTKFPPNLTMVIINTNTFDLAPVEEGTAMRQVWADIPNEADFTPVVLIDPVTYEPPPMGLEVENKAIKMASDGMVLRVYVNEKPSDFEKIDHDVIFKQKLIPNDEQSPYLDGDSIPVIYNMVDGSNAQSSLEVMGMVEFKGNTYSLAEQTCTIELNQNFEYAPGSFLVKMQVYIPHKGDGYWLVAWNAREIYSLNMPKYLIQAEGLDSITNGLYKE